MGNQRSLLLFESGIKSQATLKWYTYSLDLFLKFCKVIDYDSLVKIDPEKIQIMIEDYLMICKKKYSYGTIRYVLSHAGIKKGYHTLTWFGDLSYSKLIIPKYENELNLCPYCSEKMVRIVTRDGSLGEPPPQVMESFIDVGLWFIPEYPQFLR